MADPDPSAGEGPASERREIRYSGRVQGVGFRYATQRIAGGYRVTGFVQNLTDGRVLLVAEGEAGELDRFLADVEHSLARYIAGRQAKSQPARGEFESFTIAH